MADIGKAPEGFPRRMQAARALAGVTIEQLAERLTHEPGLGERSLRNIENGSATVQRSRQNVILEVCGLPPAFSTADFWFLEPLYDALDKLPRETFGDAPVDVLIQQAFRALIERDEVSGVDQRLAELEAAVKHLTESPDDGGGAAARIEQIETQLDTITAHLIQEQAAAGVPARQRLRFPPSRQPAAQAQTGSRRRAR